MSYRPPEPLRAHHRLDDFSCGELPLDWWLTKHARGAHAAGSARVFVATADGAAVVGYYAIAAGHVEPADATARSMQGQPNRPVPAVLLARLAVDIDHQGGGIGRSLLQDALVRCVGAAEDVGIRVILVHAKHERAKAFYLRYGFEVSPTDPLHLLMLMKDVRAHLASSA